MTFCGKQARQPATPVVAVHESGSSMTIGKSKINGRGSKPPKPRPDFPLYAHAAGVWAKRIQNKTYYFGPWADANAALERYLTERDHLYAGRAADGPPAWPIR